jgi:hypothetical protein
MRNVLFASQRCQVEVLAAMERARRDTYSQNETIKKKFGCDGNVGR